MAARVRIPLRLKDVNYRINYNGYKMSLSGEAGLKKLVLLVSNKINQIFNHIRDKRILVEAKNMVHSVRGLRPIFFEYIFRSV